VKYNDLSPRGRAFIDAYHADDPDEMDRLVRDQIQAEFELLEYQTRKEGRVVFFLVLAALAFLALIVSRWIELL
jgi:hypothetical protein